MSLPARERETNRVSQLTERVKGFRGVVATDKCEIPYYYYYDGKRHLACEIILDTETRLGRSHGAYVCDRRKANDLLGGSFAGLAEGVTNRWDFRLGACLARWIRINGKEPEFFENKATPSIFDGSTFHS